MDVEEGEAKMCRLCGQYEKIYIDVFGEEGIRRYLGTKIHKKINILIDKDDTLPQQICASCADKLDFVCDFYDSCHVIQERLWWLFESSKNQRQEIQKQLAGYQTNKGDDPTQEGVTLGTEYSIEYSNIIVKEECLPDLNLDMYPLNQETQKQPADYQTNKGDDLTQEEVTLGTEYSTEHSNIIIKEELLPDINLDMYPSNQETQKQPAGYRTNKGDDLTQEEVTLGTEYSTEHSYIIIKEECLPDINLDVYPSNQETQKQPAGYQMNKGDDPTQEGVTLGMEYLTDHSYSIIKKKCLPDINLELYPSNNPMSHVQSQFKYPRCPNVYNSNVYKRNLNEHLLNHEGRKEKFPCDTCGKIFYSHMKMRVHMRRHKSSFSCEICRNLLSSKEALEKHRKRVHLHYVCDICHKILNSKSRLRDHIIKSHLENKFQCPKCPTVYTRKQNLNKHLLKHDSIIHSEIRKYECSTCTKTYVRRSHLTSHQKVCA